MENTKQNKELSEETIIKLFELDYSTAVKRYDDNFKSLWTNFSYMAILAGGILTFGKEQLAIDLLIALASIPLIFWFWATFLPLNKYGDLIARRIAEIEKALTSLYFTKMPDLEIPHKEYNANKARQGLFLYTDFEQRHHKSKPLSILGLREYLQDRVRVRTIVWLFSFLFHLMLIFAILSFSNLGWKIPDVGKQKSIDNRLDSIEKSIQNINSILEKNNSNQINK